MHGFSTTRSLHCPRFELRSVQWRQTTTKAHFALDQIIGLLKEHLAGTRASELCHRLGISDADLLHLTIEIPRDGSDGNANLKRLLPENLLDVSETKELLAKNSRRLVCGVTPQSSSITHDTC